MRLFQIFENPQLLEGLIFAALIFGLVYAVYLLIRRLFTDAAGRRGGPPPTREAAPGTAAEEAELVERLIKQMERMEARLENLETIIGDKNKDRSKPGS